ncbi:hypothetical protein SO802_008447 [Lithocarpus litseifolius]|uniref:S5 DRBM domain-containing protein n=1 Tax=Lithocarpus litseifolius TaxID=425828 RepID=A0AAW2D8N6_9ROSI
MVERGGGERGGFGGGRPRGDNGRGGGRRARREMGPSHEARTSLEQIYLHSLPIKEYQIIDELCAGLKDMPVQKQTRAGQHTSFKAFVVVGDVTEAVGIYDSLEEFGLKDEMFFCNLIDALCEYKHVVEAYDLCFGKNKKFGVDAKNTKIYNMILRGWFKMGWWSKCREFWEEMDQMGVRKDLHSYSIYMDIMCKSGKPWKAVKLHKEMKKKGIRLDVVAYNTVIRAVGPSEGVDCSLRVFKEMRDFGCKPEVATYNTIIKLLCENGGYKEACELLDRMHEKENLGDGGFFDQPLLCGRR